MSLRERILECDDIGRKVVEVPEWDVKLELRTISAGKRAEMMQRAMGEDGQVDLTEMWPMLIVATAFDPETGEAVFTNDDIEALKGKAAAAVERLGNEAMTMAGLAGGEVDEAGKAS